MNELATKYYPAEVEDKWYAYWMEHRLFHSEPDDRDPLLHSDSAAQRYGRGSIWAYAQQYHTGHSSSAVRVWRGRMPCGCRHRPCRQFPRKTKSGGQTRRRRNKRRPTFPARNSSAMPGLDPQIRRHHPEPAEKTRSFMRLERTAFTMTTSVQESVIKGILPSLRKGADIPWRAHGQLDRRH